MGALTRDAILESSDRELKELEVPEWGGTVYLLPPNLPAMRRLADSMASDSQADLERRAARFAVELCVDPETHEPLFKGEDVERLTQEKNAIALRRIFEAGLPMVVLRDEDRLARGKASDDVELD